MLTIDRLASIVLHTIFSPVVSFLIVLLSLPVTHTLSRPLLFYALAISLLRALHALDARLAAGPARPLVWSPSSAGAVEIVLITGAAGGLGSTVARLFAARAVPVAALDVRLPPGVGDGQRDRHGVMWFACDVARRADVLRVKRLVEERLGTPTVLINNAAVLMGKPLLELTEADVMRGDDVPTFSIGVNLFGPINTMHAFLPGMLARPAGGTIVTVSSVLGFLGCARLSDYTAAKAGLTALHRSLRAELALAPATAAAPHPRAVRTVLLHPGQLGTALFAGVRSPSAFLGRVVGVDEAARRVVAAVDSGRHVEEGWPLYARWIAWMGVLPPGLRRLARRWAGLDGAAWTGLGPGRGVSV